MRLFSKRVRDSSPTPAHIAAETPGSIREFVYLDEVSVYSLTSSPDAPPPVSMSESANNSSSESLAAQVAAAAPVLVKSTVTGELKSTRSADLQVQRHFNIQSQFARLHRLYKGTFALVAGDLRLEAKPTDDLATALNTLMNKQRAARADDLTRGRLVELRVALRAHHMFDIAAFTRTVGTLITSFPEFLQVSDLSEIKQGMDAGEFLNQLMEDLVPIEGLSSNYEVVTDPDGQLWVADVISLRALYNGQFESGPLRVVGVAEKESFWKDTRRILHADSEYEVLGRVSRAGLQPKWSPVKLADTFKRVVPDITDGLDEALEAMRNISSSKSTRVDASARLIVAAARFQHELAVHYGVAPTALSDASVGTLLSLDGGLEEQLAALKAIAEDFRAAHSDLEMRSEDVAAIRQEAWRSSLLTPEETLPEPRTSHLPEALALELEFIAMYW